MELFALVLAMLRREARMNMAKDQVCTIIHHELVRSLLRHIDAATASINMLEIAVLHRDLDRIPLIRERIHSAWELTQAAIERLEDARGGVAEPFAREALRHSYISATGPMRRASDLLAARALRGTAGVITENELNYN